MVVHDYEADLSVLEEMCSELEESALLFDKNMNIVWMNKIAKDIVLQGQKQGPNIYSVHDLDVHNVDLINELCSKAFGQDIFSSESPTRKVFNTGKISKSSKIVIGRTIKRVCIPIKNDTQVVYVLEILEDLPSHPIEADDPIRTVIKKDLMGYYLSPYKNPMILTDSENNYVAANSRFEELFKDSNVLRKLILEKLHGSSKPLALKGLKELLSLSHNITASDIKYDKKIVGHAYELHRLSISTKSTKKRGALKPDQHMNIRDKLNDIMLDFLKKKDNETAQKSATLPLNTAANTLSPGLSMTKQSETLSSTANTNSVVPNAQTNAAEKKQESTLEPPKNLPDLAKDLYGSEQYIKKGIETDNSVPIVPRRMPVEPKTLSVPKLDISLVKRPQLEQPPSNPAPLTDINVSHDIITKSNTDIPGYNPLVEQQLKLKLEQEILEYIKSLSSSRPELNNFSNMTAANNTLANTTYTMPNHLLQQNNGDDKSFFKDFEYYILSNASKEGLSGNKQVLSALLSSNMLDTMSNYHYKPPITNNDSMSMLSRLQDLERLWIFSRERRDASLLLLREIESEILYKTEEFKKSLSNNPAGRSNTLDKMNSTMFANQALFANQAPNPMNNLSNNTKKLPLDFFQVFRKKSETPENIMSDAASNSPPTDNQNKPGLKDDIQTQSSIIHALSNALAEQSSIDPKLGMRDYVITDSTKYFYVADGLVLRSVKELISALVRMTDATYYTHAGDVKNDFANWLDGVYHRPDIALYVRLCKSRKELQDFLLKIIS